MTPPPLPNLNNVNPLPQAYAHNNGEHPNPLVDALQLGYTYIEADVRLIRNEIYVYHDSPKTVNQNRSLSKLYFDPLYKLQELNNGFIFPTYKKPLNLMLDIKTEGHATYEKLKEILVPYQPMLSCWENNIVFSKAVNIIISGDPPIQQVAKETKRYVQVDGRLKDLKYNYPSAFMPIISDNALRAFGFRALFPRWLGESNFRKLTAYAEEAHRQSKIIRLWNTPEREAFWDKLITSGIDLLNADDLERLSSYLGNK